MTGTGRLPKWVEEKIHELIRRAETAERKLVRMDQLWQRDNTAIAEMREVIERAAKAGSPGCQEYLEAHE